MVISLAAALALAALLLPLPTAQAQISFAADLGANEANLTSGTPLSITTVAAAQAGASIIVVATTRTNVILDLPTAVTCSDSAGSTYTTDGSQAGTGTFTTICATHQIATALPSGATITVTWTGGMPHPNEFNERARAFAVTGLASTPLDRTAAATSGSMLPVPLPSSGATLPTTQADELLVGAIGIPGFTAASAGFSPGTHGTVNPCATSGTPTYTALAGVGSGEAGAVFGMYCIVSATGAYAVQASLDPRTSWDALLVTYKGQAASPMFAFEYVTSAVSLLSGDGTRRQRGQR